MRPVHEDISDLLSDDAGEDRFVSPIEARKKAMDFLARREYGRAELVRKLTGKGFDADVAGAAVDRLEAEGLQSDARFAESFVQSRVSQGKGPVRIRAELGQKGIGDTAIELALEASGVDWFALAAEQRVKKFGRGRPADFAQKARQMRFLQYRGFDTGHIQAAVSAEPE